MSVYVYLPGPHPVRVVSDLCATELGKGNKREVTLPCVKIVEQNGRGLGFS